MLYITKYLSYCVLTHLPTISALCTTHCDHFVYWIMIHCTLQKLHLNDICYCVLIWCKMFQIFILLCITQHYMYWCQLSILILWHVRLDPGYSTCHNVFNPHANFLMPKYLTVCATWRNYCGTGIGWLIKSDTSSSGMVLWEGYRGHNAMILLVWKM